jgi:hypothetical protein
MISVPMMSACAMMNWNTTNPRLNEIPFVVFAVSLLFKALTGLKRYKKMEG